MRVSLFSDFKQHELKCLQIAEKIYKYIYIHAIQYVRKGDMNNVAVLIDVIQIILESSFGVGPFWLYEHGILLIIKTLV